MSELKSDQSSCCSRLEPLFQWSPIPSTKQLMCVHHIKPLTPLIGLSSKETTTVAHNHLLFISFFNSMSVTVWSKRMKIGCTGLSGGCQLLVTITVKSWFFFLYGVCCSHFDDRPALKINCTAGSLLFYYTLLIPALMRFQYLCPKKWEHTSKSKTW